MHDGLPSYPKTTSVSNYALPCLAVSPSQSSQMQSPLTKQPIQALNSYPKAKSRKS